MHIKSVVAIACFSSLIGLSLIPAHAARYTTRDNGSSSQNSPQKKQTECTSYDLDQIKDFNRLIAEFREEIEEITEYMQTLDTEAQINSSKTRKKRMRLNQISQFRFSSEYRAMEAVYKRCNLTVPPFAQQPAGLPQIN